MCQLTMGLGHALWNASLGAFATVQTSSAHTQTKTANELTKQYNLGESLLQCSPFQMTWVHLSSERSKIQYTLKRSMGTQDLEEEGGNELMKELQW